MGVDAVDSEGQDSVMVVRIAAPENTDSGNIHHAFVGDSREPVLLCLDRVETDILHVADATASAQELLGLPATGAADAETWTAVEALSLQLAAFTPNPDRHPEQGPDYPGRAMKEGSVGPDVSLIEGWVNDRSQLYCEEDYVADNAVFGPEDTAAVKETQQRAGLEANGVVDRPTWAALRAQSHTACDSCTEEG